MCYEIDSEIILANYFLEPKRKTCKIEDLVMLKRKIEKKFPDVYVDVTRDSIFSTIENYPNMYFWNDNRINRKPKSTKYFKPSYINSRFNNRIEKNDLKKDIKSVIIASFNY